MAAKSAIIVPALGKST